VRQKPRRELHSERARNVIHADSAAQPILGLAALVDPAVVVQIEEQLRAMGQGREGNAKFVIVAVPCPDQGRLFAPGRAEVDSWFGCRGRKRDED